MAGKVAKYGSLPMSFGSGKSNSEYHEESGSGSGNGKRSHSKSGNIMEEYIMIGEDAIIKSLGIEVERKKALRYLDKQFHENNSLLIFQEKNSLFRGFSQALCDSDVNIRIDCTKLIAKIIPQLGPDREQCMKHVLPKIVSNVGNCTALQKESIQTLHICMKNSADVYHILKVIAENGIKHEDRDTRKQIIHTFPTLLFSEFKNEDFFDIVMALTQNLNNGDSDNIKVMKTLSQVKKFVGGQRFTSYINELPSPLQSLYNEMIMISSTISDNIGQSNRSTPSLLHETYANGGSSHSNIMSSNISEQTEPISKNVPDFGMSGYFDSASVKNSLGRGFKVRPNYLTQARSPEMIPPLSNHYEFGFIAKSIIENLSSTDNKTRHLAVEDLTTTLSNLRDVTSLRKHMVPLVSLLQPVIEDNNYKVSCSALQALDTIVKKMGQDVRPFVKLIVTAAAKRIGSKDVIRAECMKVLLDLEEVTDSGTVLAHFWSKLQHKQAKIREETVNLVIASLIKFPVSKNNIDISKLSGQLAIMLIDPKPKVRNAAFECISAISHLYGSGSLVLRDMISAIDHVELMHDEATGIMSAVQARIMRKQLPRLRENMLVEHAITPLQLHASQSHGGAPQAADINWVLSTLQPSGSNSQSSMSHIMDSRNSSFNSSMEVNEVTQDGLSSDNRRHPSAGKRGVFPWAKGNENPDKHPSSAPVQTQRTDLNDTHPPPVRPRNTWGPESQEKIAASIAALTQQQSPAQTRPNRVNDPGSSTSGGYLEIHQRKQANAINKESLTNVGTPVRQRKQVEGESVGLHSAPTMGRNMSVSGTEGYQPSFGSSDVTIRHPRPTLGSLKSPNDILSNSCPTTFFDENNQVKKFNKSSRRSPLASVSNEASGQKSIPDEPESPIPLKPQLARSSAKRRGSPNGQNQLNLQAPINLKKNSASPRLDRIADNPTLENVRPIFKQNRGHNEAKLNGSYTDFLDSSNSGGRGGTLPTSGYTPSGLQPPSDINLPMAVIRHPSHQMKNTSVANASRSSSIGLTFHDNDPNNNALSHQKNYVPSNYSFDPPDLDSDALSHPNNRLKSDSHTSLKMTKSLPHDSHVTSEIITHPRLLQKTSSPILSETPRSAPHHGIREEELQYKSSIELIRHSAQKKRNQMQRSLSSGKDLNTMGSGLDGSFSSTISGPSSGRATAPESGSTSSSILSPVSNKTNSHTPSPIQATSRDSIENFYINGYQSTQNRRSSRTDSEPSSTYSTDTGYMSTVNDPRKLRKSGKIDADANPFMTKPSIARPGSGKGSGSSPNGTFAATSREIIGTATDPPPFQYRPNAGVSFVAHKTKSNVSVVGYGYGLRSPSSSENTFTGSSPTATPTNSTMNMTVSPGSSSISSKPSLTSIGSNQNAREKRRSQRGPSNGATPGSVSEADDGFNITGIAIRDASSTNLSDVQDFSLSPNNNDSLPWSPYSADPSPPVGVYGVGVRQPSVESDISNDDGQRESVPLSKSLVANEFKKKEDLEQFRRTKNRKQKSQASDQDLSMNDIFSGLNIDNSSSNGQNTTTKQPSKPKLIRKNQKSPNNKVSPPRAQSLDRRSGSRDSTALRTTTDILPISNPDSSLNDAITRLQGISHEAWEETCNHLHTIRRLARFHQETLATRTHEVLVTLCTHALSLRSQVSRAGVVSLTEFYTHLRKPAIDTDVEPTTRALLTLIGRNPGAFIQEEIAKTFQYMVAHVTSTKLLNALLTVGAGSTRNTSIRDMTAQFVDLLVDRMGPGKALSGVKDTTDRILPAALTFISNPSRDTRYYGRCIVQKLMLHQDFDRCVEKYLSQKQAQEMKEALQYIRTKGVGSLGSAGTRNNGSGVRRNGSTRGLSRTGNSTTTEILPQISSKSSRKGTPAKTVFNEKDQEEIRSICKTLEEGDIQARKENLKKLNEKLLTQRPLVEDNIVKVMDGLRCTLMTANSKLNNLGLEMIYNMIPDLGNQLPPSDLVPTVCRLLVSKQQNTAQLASKVVNSMLDHIDHLSLLQQFANCAMYSPGRTKQVCIEKLSELVATVSTRKMQAIERHVLPVLLSLLSEKHAMNLRRETTILAKALYAAMGDSLLTYAEAKNAKAKVVEMIHS